MSTNNPLVLKWVSTYRNKLTKGVVHPARVGSAAVLAALHGRRADTTLMCRFRLGPPGVAAAGLPRRSAAEEVASAPAPQLVTSNRRLPAAMASSTACRRGLLVAGSLTLLVGVLAVTLNQRLFDAILDKVSGQPAGPCHRVLGDLRRAGRGQVPRVLPQCSDTGLVRSAADRGQRGQNQGHDSPRDRATGSLATLECFSGTADGVS